MRSAPTLKIWITPLASVAMLEKLALSKMAFCKAPALSSASSAFLRIGDLGWRDFVHHLQRRIAQHALSADVKNLDHAVGVGGDAGEISAVENGLLQGAGFEQRLFGLPADRRSRLA